MGMQTESMTSSLRRLKLIAVLAVGVTMFYFCDSLSMSLEALSLQATKQTGLWKKHVRRPAWI